MASKPKGKQRGEVLKQEDVIQAVVIADSFNVRFAPITKKKPRTLLPVANVPMIDYTLEFLVTAGVQEIFVFCCHLADQVRSHIRNSKWNNCSTCTVTPILSDDCMSMGDALREIHDKSVIKSDFILVFGDVVANIKLQRILEEHKKRREKDSSSVMTMIFKKSPPGHKSRCKEDDIVMAIDNTSDRVLHYQKVTEQSKLQLPVEVLSDHSNVQLRYDLLDSQVSICTSQVPALFKDNFDYLTRDDFVKGILINEEIMGNTIHVKVVNDEYSGRISNLQMYDAVSRDILSRWTHPLVPDSCTDTENQINHSRHNIYTSKDVTLARGCVLEKNVLVGKGTCVGSNTRISNSVIGKDCKIGSNVNIESSYIWDGVVIEDDCQLHTCIVCDNVKIYKSTHVNQGCILSWDVKVGPNVNIKECTKLQSSVDEDDADFEDELPEVNQSENALDVKYGSQSLAYLYQAPEDSDEDEEGDIVLDMWGLSLQAESSEESTSVSEESSMNDEPMLDDEELFYSEFLDTLVKAKEENYKTENLILEINSLKHTYNIGIRDLYGMVLKGLIDLPLRESSEKETEMISNVKKSLVKNSSLIKNYIKSEESQLDCLHALEEFALSSANINTLLVKLLHILYDMEILSETAILKWHKSSTTGENEEEYAAVRKQVAPLIKWLEEAEEESSEEEDSD